MALENTALKEKGLSSLSRTFRTQRAAHPVTSLIARWQAQRRVMSTRWHHLLLHEQVSQKSATSNANPHKKKSSNVPCQRAVDTSYVSYE